MWEGQPSTMSILQAPRLTPLPYMNLSTLRILSASNHELSLISQISQLSFHLQSSAFPATTATIQMRGGPRKYPGGLNKYQWRRVKAVKAKKLHRAGVRREQQFYRVRKRAELRAAVSELERPWEAVKGSPESVSLMENEQLKFFDRFQFQKPGDYECSEEDYEESNLSSYFPGSEDTAGDSSVERGNWRSDCGAYGSESDNDGEDGYGNLVIRSKSQVMEGTYWKNSRDFSREERVSDALEPDKVERIQISGDKKDYPTGSSRNKGKLDSEKIVWDKEEISEITSPKRGRYGPNARERNRGRVSRKLKLSHSGEVLNFKWDGTYNSRVNQRSG